MSRKPKFSKGQVVKMQAYKGEYVLITGVWPWTEDGKQHGWGYTMKTAQKEGEDRCHERFLRPLTAREKGRERK